MLKDRYKFNNGNSAIEEIQEELQNIQNPLLRVILYWLRNFPSEINIFMATSPRSVFHLNLFDMNPFIAKSAILLISTTFSTFLS